MSQTFLIITTNANRRQESNDFPLYETRDCEEREEDADEVKAVQFVRFESRQ